MRDYRDQKLATVGIEGVYPLWNLDTKNLMIRFIDLGFKSVIVCTNSKFLDNSFLGRELDKSLLEDLPADVDPCGENGEYHSFVYDGPIFKSPIDFKRGEVVFRQYDNTSNSPANDTGFWYLDLLEK